MQACWAQEPVERPGFQELARRLKAAELAAEREAKNEGEISDKPNEFMQFQDVPSVSGAEARSPGGGVTSSAGDTDNAPEFYSVFG